MMESWSSSQDNHIPLVGESEGSDTIVPPQLSTGVTYTQMDSPDCHDDPSTFQLNQESHAVSFPEEEFHTAVSDPINWDLLMEAGSGAKMPSEWKRESLYQKFDPLANIATPPRPVQRMKSDLLETTEENETSLMSSPLNMQSPERLNDQIAAKEMEFKRILQEKDNRIQELEEMLARSDIKGGDSSLSRVLEEYEKTMSGYIQEIDKRKGQLDEADEEKAKLIRERDQAYEDLRNVERAFSDVHKKYERAKGLLENFRKNEEILKKRDQELTEKVANRDSRIEQLKEKVQATLEQMHTDYEGKIKEMEVECNRQRVLIRKADLKVETLQNDVEHKTRELSKLSVLCDELINGSVK